MKKNWKILIVISTVIMLFNGCKKDNLKDDEKENLGIDCGATFTDNRDGITYKVIKIGTQCWLAENLKYVTANSWCYDNDEANCSVYGRLYNWDAALTACPNGWHLPSDAEWTQLTDFLGGVDVAGGKMKLQTTDIAIGFYPFNTGATNESGFSGLPGGSRDYNGAYDFKGTFGIWWSSTETNSTNAWVRSLKGNLKSISKTGPNKPFAHSCRCIKD